MITHRPVTPLAAQLVLFKDQFGKKKTKSGWWQLFINITNTIFHKYNKHSCNKMMPHPEAKGEPRNGNLRNSKFLLEMVFSLIGVLISATKNAFNIYQCKIMIRCPDVAVRTLSI